jgi:hypothetical protein
MKGEKERIDQLLDENAAEQLARVDWDRLRDQISARLDQTRRIEIIPHRYSVVYKIAGAALAAAAVVVFALIVFEGDKPSDMQVPEGRSAVVEFVDKQGAASILLSDATGKSSVLIHTGHADGKAARCEVQILNRYGDLEKESSRATWIIISRPQQTIADNGRSKDETDVLCML